MGRVLSSPRPRRGDLISYGRLALAPTKCARRMSMKRPRRASSHASSPGASQGRRLKSLSVRIRKRSCSRPTLSSRADGAFSQGRDRRRSAPMPRAAVGRRHRVLTAIAVAHAGRPLLERTVETRVAFKVLSAPEIARLYRRRRVAGKGGRLCHSRCRCAVRRLDRRLILQRRWPATLRNVLSFGRRGASRLRTPCLTFG